MFTKPFVERFMGKNSQIPLFFKIINLLPLFEKYIIFLKLEFTKTEKYKKVYETQVSYDIKFIACVSNSLATFFTPFSQLLTHLLSHVTLTKGRKKWNPHLEANEKTEKIRNKIGSQQLWRQWEYWKNKKKKLEQNCVIHCNKLEFYMIEFRVTFFIIFDFLKLEFHVKLRVRLDWAYCCWNWKLKTL